MRRETALALAVCLGPVGSGCAWTEGGVRKTLVIGFGVVETTPVSTEDTGSSVVISNTRVFGVFLGGTTGLSGFVAGYAQSQRVAVSTEAQALIETVSYDDGTLRVCVMPVVVKGDGSEIEIEGDER